MTGGTLARQVAIVVDVDAVQTRRHACHKTIQKGTRVLISEPGVMPGEATRVLISLWDSLMFGRVPRVANPIAR